MFNKFSRKTLAMVSALALVAGLASSATWPASKNGKADPHGFIASAQAQERAQSINATTGNYAVIAPIYTGLNNGPFSFLRLINGSGTTGDKGTYTITMVGAQTGQVYGHSFAVQVPHMGGAQFSMDQLAALAGTSLNSFSGGDTGYALYIQNPDLEAGYQHVTFNPNSQLFENLSSCDSLLNEQMTSQRSELVRAYIHTSKGTIKPGTTYPSAIQIHNYYNVPLTYTITVFNAGEQTNGVSSSTSGNVSCQIRNKTIPANTTLTLSEATDIEGNSQCTFYSDEDYINITIAERTGGPPNAVPMHLVHASAYGSDVNITDICAVNKITPASTGTTGIGGGGSPYL